jgi:MoxR-like ATPase
MSEPLEDLEPCADPEWVVRAQSHVAEQVRADEEVINYTASIVRLTRPEVSDLTLPLSRGSFLAVSSSHASQKQDRDLKTPGCCVKV